MKRHTVKQLAALSGITVRTLHHYDEIGLLKPAYHGENGYRYYEREQLLRLQDILFYRELGVPLQDIPAMLATSGADRVAALRGHRRRLEGELARYGRLIRTIDETIDDLTGGKAMQDRDIFEGFAPPRQAEYEAYLIDRYGEPTRARIEESKRQAKSWSKADVERFMTELSAIEADFAAAMAEDLPAHAPRVQELAARHFRWVCHSWTPDATSYAGLGQLYVEHPDFRARFEAIRPGLAEFLKASMDVYANGALRAGAAGG